VRDELRGRPRRSGPPQPPDHIEELIYYFDQQPRPPHLQKPDADPDSIHRWELTRLRNRALLHALAESGGRISEILSLDVDDFPVRYLDRGEVLRVEVSAKGGHTYQLRFLNALPAIRQYLEAAGASLRATKGRAALFVATTVASTARGGPHRRLALGAARRRRPWAEKLTPHDFRHWRATPLINAGPRHGCRILGHRSVETITGNYAHTDPQRLDDAARQIGIPAPATRRKTRALFVHVAMAERRSEHYPDEPGRTPRNSSGRRQSTPIQSLE